MPIYQWLSLTSVIVMSLAFWCSKICLENENTVFALQIAGYLLWSASSWLIGIRSAALVFAICAVTLTLKMLHRFRALVMFSFLVATLVSGLIINNRGWIGILPIIAGLGVIYRHAFGYVGSIVILDRMDNAYRMRTNAFGLFMYNIVGVILWGVYAWLIGDQFMLAWRVFMLALNLYNYAIRILPKLSRSLATAIPDPSRSKRRKYPGQKRKRDWTI